MEVKKYNPFVLKPKPLPKSTSKPLPKAKTKP